MNCLLSLISQIKNKFHFLLKTDLQRTLVRRSLLLWAAAFCSQFALAAPSTTFSGFVEKTSNGVFIKNADSTQLRISIVGVPLELRDTFSKLSSGDFVTGSGILQPSGQTMFIESIETVGLQKIIGRWTNRENVLVFKSFSELQVSTNPADKDSGASQQNNFGSEKSNLRYSLAPGQTDDWTIFMSNQDATVLGSLSVDANTAVLKIFNPDTGKTMKILRLSKAQ
ncbi:MAG TPA: hypothetical protein PLU50_08490 [Pseudobdellovibrionaceae bacterium]|nr:hypothetical protein [Pseudobdellovibrionaceae bacterium]